MGPDKPIEPEEEPEPKEVPVNQVSGEVLLKCLYVLVKKLRCRVSVKEATLEELPEDWADTFTADAVTGPHGQRIFRLTIKQEPQGIIVPTPRLLKNRIN